ncbi:hypothetical protein KY285_007731 [Solanum tuberosum]|nr:hypothetical protein KY285_007731 [Solanum tuberosum]
MSTTSPVNITEGDLPKSKSSESNILPASESMNSKSLAQMREGVRNEEGSSFIDDLLGDSEPVFDQTPEVRVAPLTDSSDTDEDNIPLKWAVQRIMVHVTTKGKEKNRRRRKSKEVVIEFPTEDVVDVSNELSENEFVDDDITAQ